MDLFLYPIIGTLLLLLIFLKKPRSLSIKLRLQFVAVSTLLVYLALLLFSLYNLFIAAFAFIGLFLLFGLMIGKQLEYEIGTEDHGELVYEQAGYLEAAGTIEDDLKEEPIKLIEERNENQSISQDEKLGKMDRQSHVEVPVQEERIVENGAWIEQIKQAKEQDEEDLIDYFEGRPREILLSDDDTYQEEDALMLKEGDDPYADDDLPIRIPYYEEEEEHSLAPVENTFREQTQEDDMLSNREKLFKQLEENER